MRSEGSTVSGTAHYTDRPLPRATPGPRPSTFVHQQRSHTTGLDFDALAPACKTCGTRSAHVSCETVLCPKCSGATTSPEPAAPPEKIAGVSTAAAVRLYETGLSLKAVAEKMGTSIRTVQRSLAAHGVEARPKGTRAPVRDLAPTPQTRVRQDATDELNGGSWVADGRGVKRWVPAAGGAA